MNISQESAPTWLGSRLNNQSSNISNSEDSSNPHVWDLRWFPILSAPLLFGTIILPLMTGPIIRSVCQTYVKLRIYWVIITLTLLAPATFVVYTMDPGYHLTAIWDTVLICVALSTIWNARRHPWHRSRRILFGLLLLTLSICDLASVMPFLGFAGWILNFAGLIYSYRPRWLRSRKYAIFKWIW